MKPGDIYWVEFPDRGGREQRGTRPAIVWQDTEAFPNLPTLLLIPLTSKQDALRFAGTILIQPTSNNGLATASVVMVFQMSVVDIRRLTDRIGALDDADLVRLRDLARKFQKLE